LAKVIHIITGLGDGGAEAILVQLIKNQHNPSNHTVVSLTDKGKYGEILTDLGVPLITLNLSMSFHSIRSIVKLFKYIKSNDGSTIQTWMYHADLLGGIVSRLAGNRKVFWGIHNTILDIKKSKFTTILISRINSILSYWVPCRIICCAEYAKDVHVLIGFCEKKIVIVNNGYDTSVFKPNIESGLSLRNKLYIDSDFFVIGMVARFDPYKDHYNLLAAVSLLKKYNVKFKCVLVGEGIIDSNCILTKWIDDMQLSNNIVLLGPRNDIVKIMNMFNIHVLSSFAEAFPNVLSESMSCATPVVSTDVGDARYIVGDTGWVVPSKDPNALCEAIMSAYIEHETPKWNERCQLSRRRVKYLFNVKRMVLSYEAVWSMKD
jgi:glycosyltransferase involved in cell wall biosynthesis